MTRHDIFARIAAIVRAAAPDWTVREHSSLAVDDIRGPDGSELPIANIVDAGEDTTPPDGASDPIRRLAWHWTAIVEIELLARTRAEIGATSSAVVAAIVADETLAEMLDAAPEIEVRPAVYPDGQPRAGERLTLTLPYSRRD